MSEKPLTSKANGPPITTASVVLLVENEVLERVPKAVHLRTAGFNVVEAADGEEARHVIDSVPVHIVFADLAMPDHTNGLAFLRWLRKPTVGLVGSRRPVWVNAARLRLARHWICVPA